MLAVRRLAVIQSSGGETSSRNERGTVAMPEPAEKEPSRHWAMRLLLAVRAAATQLSRMCRREVRDREQETRRVEKYLLIVVRTYASLDRVMELQHLLKAEPGIAVKFTVQRGSKFSRALTARLMDEGAHVLSWREAKRQRWDAILTAYAHRRLAQLRGPLFCIPHGVGYNRRRFASTKDNSSVGLSRYEHVSNGRVFAARIGLSNEEQRSRLFEEARDRAVVIGDFVLDKLRASRVLRTEIREALGVGSRRLVVVTSTWGSCSALRAQAGLIKRLLARLPADEYAIALVLHPNVWHGESPLEIRTQFGDEIDSGLLLVEHHTWQAPLVAADLVIGDHGSVTGYAVGLDLPVLLAANGADEMDPGSPVHALHTALPRLCPRSDLRTQIEHAISDHEPGRWTSFTDRIFGLPGEGLRATLAVLFELMKLPAPAKDPRPKRVRIPEVLKGDAITSYRVVVRLEECGTRGVVERYPAIVTTADDVPGSVIVSCHDEVDQTVKDNAEIFLHKGQLTREEAERWLAACLSDCPGTALAAAALTGGGCLLLFRDGTSFTTTRGDPFVAAAVLYQRRVIGGPGTTSETTVNLGHESHTVAVS
jgi:hypothetical protein